MKELSIAEKAKRYDKALTKARNIVNSINVGLIGKDSFEAVFPELKESEDGKIRKWIKKELESKYVIDNIVSDVMADKALAWLEKQGEKAKYHDICDKCVRQPTCQSDCFLQQGEQKPAETEKGAKGNEREIPNYAWSEWNKEDEKVIKWVIDYIGNCPNENFDFYGGVGKEAVLSWLNKLKNILQLQPKQEWSKEDKKKISRIYSILSEASDEHAFFTTNRILGDKECVELQEWLKSLRPQSQWKPSDEQMNALNYVINLMASSERPIDNDLRYNILKSLRQQLKKIRED